MIQQPKSKINITHNILWRKWEQKKKQYEQQRSTKNSCIGFTSNYEKLMKAKYNHQTMSQNNDQENNGSAQHANGTMVVQRKSYQQFLEGAHSQFDVNWLMVGQPRAFYISDRRKTTNQQKPQAIKSVQLKLQQSSDKKRTKSPSWKRLKTYTPVYKQNNFKRYLKTSNSGYYQISQPQFKKTKVKTQPSFIQRRSRKNSRFQCRPWSRSQKQSVVDFNPYHTH